MKVEEEVDEESRVSPRAPSDVPPAVDVEDQEEKVPGRDTRTGSVGSLQGRAQPKHRLPALLVESEVKMIVGATPFGWSVDQV